MKNVTNRVRKEDYSMKQSQVRIVAVANDDGAASNNGGGGNGIGDQNQVDTSRDNTCQSKKAARQNFIVNKNL